MMRIRDDREAGKQRGRGLETGGSIRNWRSPKPKAPIFKNRFLREPECGPVFEPGFRARNRDGKRVTDSCVSPLPSHFSARIPGSKSSPFFGPSPWLRNPHYKAAAPEGGHPFYLQNGRNMIYLCVDITE